jgi:FRG domain-containing protein
MEIGKSPDTWEELSDALWSRSLSSEVHEYRPYVAYRGMPMRYDNLKTGIQRLREPSPLGDLQWRERRVIDTFSLYAQEHLPPNFSDWDVLLLGQHFRLPTRLLDWTSSPYVALFFATEQFPDEDGIVWCVERIKTIDALPEQLQHALANEQSGKIFRLETLRKLFPGGLKDFGQQPADALLWFEPPSLDPRIVNQYALFSMMPSVDSLQNEWFEKYPKWHWGVPIPARLKTEIRRRLQILNITERIIYPGLEGIARWLRNYYS